MITYRFEKGEKLTPQEVDNNFLYIENKTKKILSYKNLFQIEIRYGQGIASGNFTAGAWRTRDFNTIVINNIPNADLTNKQIYLPKGLYYCEGYAIGFYCNRHVIRLQQILNEQNTLLNGLTGYSNPNTGPSQNFTMIQGEFELTDESVLELQHQCQTTRNTDGFGVSELYCDYGTFGLLKFWKLKE